MDFKKPGQKTYEYVFDYFSEQILNGDLRLNDKVPTERAIAEKLQVSRNSVREGMHMMELAGLIECRQGSGNYVCCQPEKNMMNSIRMVMRLLQVDYLEVFHIRCGYEYTALKLAISSATEEDLRSLGDVVHRMGELQSIEESAKLDMRFHEMLVQFSYNRMLILYTSMISSLSNEFIVNLRKRILLDKRRAEQLQDAHEKIYEAMVAKDYAAGRAAMERHFAIVEEQVKRMQA